MDHHLTKLSRENFDKIYFILNNGDVIFKTYGVEEVR